MDPTGVCQGGSEDCQHRHGRLRQLCGQRYPDGCGHCPLLHLQDWYFGRAGLVNRVCCACMHVPRQYFTLLQISDNAVHTSTTPLPAASRLSNKTQRLDEHMRGYVRWYILCLVIKDVIVPTFFGTKSLGLVIFIMVIFSPLSRPLCAHQAIASL